MSAAPLRAVRDAVTAGARSPAEVSRTTGLREDVVTAAVAHLVRMGLLDATPLTAGCPPAGCGTCPSGGGVDRGCGASTARPGGAGPVLVQVTVPVRR